MKLLLLSGKLLCGSLKHSSLGGNSLLIHTGPLTAGSSCMVASQQLLLCKKRVKVLWGSCGQKDLSVRVEESCCRIPSSRDKLLLGSQLLLKGSLLLLLWLLKAI